MNEVVLGPHRVEADLAVAGLATDGTHRHGSPGRQHDPPGRAVQSPQSGEGRRADPRSCSDDR